MLQRTLNKWIQVRHISSQVKFSWYNEKVTPKELKEHFYLLNKVSHHILKKQRKKWNIYKSIETGASDGNIGITILIVVQVTDHRSCS